MTWNEIVDKQEQLFNLIEMFHPNSTNKTDASFKITAPRAEEVCEVIRKETQEFFPVELAKRAISTRNSTDLIRVLSNTWLGAPESREVFSIRGFSLLCDILDEGIDEVHNE